MVEKRILFCNKASTPRREYGVATVPFAEGEWFGSPKLAVMHNKPDDRPFYLRAFGAKYADGSYRYGQGYFPLTMRGFAEQVATLRVDSSMVYPPTQTPAAMIPVNADPHIKINNLPVTEGTMTFQQIEANDARTVLKVKYRMGDFVVEIYMYLYKDQPYVPFEARVTASNPLTLNLTHEAQSIVLVVPGATVSVYGAERKGAQRIASNALLLASNKSFGNGQSQCWYGNAYFETSAADMYNPYSADANPLWGMSLDWKASGAYGPFGTVPEALTTNSSEKVQYIQQKYAEYYQYKSTAGNLWDDLLYGLTKVPGIAGDQRDFGMMAGWETIESGRPELLELYRLVATEEAMRPGHYMESSGVPVTSANHPNWVTWSGVTHWHPVVSPDKLGKVGIASLGECNDWAGKDNEHWSSNLLYAASVLTHSYQLVDELNVEAELFLSSHTIPSMKPGWSSNDMYPARAIGRTYYSMGNNYLVTAREDIKLRVQKRTEECILQQWAGKNAHPVRPLYSIGPDARQLPEHPSWLCWQEALGMPGIEAWYQLTGLQLYRDLAVTIGANQVTYGWRVRTVGPEITEYDAASAVRWYGDGTPITAEQYFDTSNPPIYYCASGIMAPWTVSCLKIVKERFTGLVSPEVQDKAGKLLDLITANRTGIYDRMGEWLV